MFAYEYINILDVPAQHPRMMTMFTQPVVPTASKTSSKDLAENFSEVVFRSSIVLTVVFILSTQKKL